MAGFTLEERIFGGPHRVFQALSDPDDYQHYVPGIVRSKRLTPGPLAKGTRWKETRRFKVMGIIPVRASSTLEVTEYEPPLRYGVVFDDGCNHVTYTFDLEEEEDGATRVRLDCVCKGVGKYEGNAKVAARLERMMRKHDGDILIRAKRYVESRET